ncbi:hypothetical protein [Paraburkholderia sp. SIMBA_027]|uniref:hypothetical protein n=1 Tax=Paraburkholderia sp. SIMBA_027 TaxID=3085770 RepID=UPI00397C1E0B
MDIGLLCNLQIVLRAAELARRHFRVARSRDDRLEGRAQRKLGLDEPVVHRRIAALFRETLEFGPMVVPECPPTFISERSETEAVGTKPEEKGRQNRCHRHGDEERQRRQR